MNFDELAEPPNPYPTSGDAILERLQEILGALSHIDRNVAVLTRLAQVLLLELKEKKLIKLAKPVADVPSE